MSLWACGHGLTTELAQVKTKYSPLHLAVRFGHVQVVRLLLAASDVNIGDEQARPAALLIACIVAELT